MNYSKFQTAKRVSIYSIDKEIIDKIERTTDSLTKNSKIIFKISSQNPNQLI